MNYLKLAKIVVPALILFVVLWGAFNFGTNHERRKADIEIAALNEAHTKTLTDLDRTNRAALQAATERARAAEQRRVTDMAAIDARYQELEDAKQRTEADLAAVRAGDLRLRNRFTCNAGAAGTDSRVSEAGASPDVGDDATPSGLQVADAELFVRFADEADTVVRQLAACQAIVAADRQ